MTMQPKALILKAPGTNCDRETAHAFQCAGGQAETLTVGRLLESPRLLSEFQILCIPGGFSYGDDLASGRILGVQLRRLAEPLQKFVAAGKLILGICNGFQVLLQCGLLAGGDPPGNAAATLTWNASGRFDDRWVDVAVQGSKCVFLAGIRQMYLPVAHGEGRFAASDAAMLAEFERRGQLVLRYPRSDGAPGDIAGMCDDTGRILGIMPHPERFIDPTQHPRWTRGEGGNMPDGLRLFQNAANYFW
jgi:phosphoribosylformylglycinamidine synthase I